MQKVSATLYQRGSAVMGLHLESFDAKSIDSAGLFYTKIHHVLPSPWRWSTHEDMVFVLPIGTQEVLRFCSVPLQAEVVYEVIARHPVHPKKGGKIRPFWDLCHSTSPVSRAAAFSSRERVRNGSRFALRLLEFLIRVSTLPLS